MKKVVGIALVLTLVSATHAPAREQRPIREGLQARGGTGDLDVRARPERARPDALTSALRAGRLTPSAYALWRARSLFDRAEVTRRFGRIDPAGTHDATMVLRDLAVQRNSLPAELREEADELLARPTDRASDPLDQGYSPGVTVKTSCMTKTNPNTGKSMKLCFHWVTKTSDRSSSTQVSRTKSAFSHTFNVEVGSLKFKSPLPDSRAKTRVNKNGGLDIYLADLGASGLYGYCTTDDGRRNRSRQVSAYCVMDNDYSSGQYAPDTFGLTALNVTAAHEFFHAVQFAYDWKEAKWLMEGTAAWIEDVVFDINGTNMTVADPNFSFLHDSALMQPEISLDAYGSSIDGQHFEYGAWVFWRYLTEYFPTATHDVIRETWDRAVGTSALAAMTGEVNQRMSPFLCGNETCSFTDVWTDYGIANRAYTAFYGEGLAYWNYLQLFMPWDAVFRLASGGTTGPRTMNVPKLGTRYVAFYPEASVPNGYELDIDLPSELANSSALMIFTAPYPGNDFCVSWFYPDSNGDFSDVEFTQIDNPCTGTEPAPIFDPIDIIQAFLVLGNPSASARNESYQATVVAD